MEGNGRFKKEEYTGFISYFGLSHFNFWVTTLFEFHCFPSRSSEVYSVSYPRRDCTTYQAVRPEKNNTHSKNFERHKKSQNKCMGGAWRRGCSVV